MATTSDLGALGPSSPVPLAAGNATAGNATNATAAPCGPTGPLQPELTIATSLVFMLLGTSSNLAALAVVGRLYRRFRSRPRASFLVFAGGLVLTDVSGQLVTGSLVARAYGAGLRWGDFDDGPSAGSPSPGAGSLCRFFGACMVFFALAPLALGTAMAAERCVGVSLPLRFAARPTARGARRAVLAVWAGALALAAMPVVGAGAYVPHFPGSWCFADVRGQAAGAGALPALAFALLFSAVGLACLAASLVCNAVTVVNLARARRRRWRRERRTSLTASARRGHDVEMAVQLVAIMLVGTVCWSPFLVTVAMFAWRHFWEPDSDCVFLVSAEKQRFLLLLRLACCNQVLDPWVYILLRRTVLRAVCRLLGRHMPAPHKMGSLLSSLRRSLSVDPRSTPGQLARDPSSPAGRGAGSPPARPGPWRGSGGLDGSSKGGPSPSARRHRATAEVVVSSQRPERDDGDTVEAPRPGSPVLCEVGASGAEKPGTRIGAPEPGFPAQGAAATPGVCEDGEAAGRA